jgi:hypothetical protein
MDILMDIGVEQPHKDIAEQLTLRGCQGAGRPSTRPGGVLRGRYVGIAIGQVPEPVTQANLRARWQTMKAPSKRVAGELAPH